MPSSTYSVTLDSSGLKADISVTQASVDKYIQSCLRDSCIMLKDYAKRNHGFKNRTGDLERAIRYRVVSRINTGIVYVDPKEVPYAIYVHEDTGTFYDGKKYPIFPRRVKALSFFWERYGEWGIFPMVNHPGSKGDKFLFKALESNKTNIDNIFMDGLRKLINV